MLFISNGCFFFNDPEHPWEEPMYSENFKLGLIIINSILVLISIKIFIKERKEMRPPQCSNCGSRIGIKRCDDKIFKDGAGDKQIEITFGCKNCGFIIYTKTWDMEFYRENINRMHDIYDKKAELYRYEDW